MSTIHNKNFIIHGKSYVAWFYQIYYYKSAFPNAKLEKYRKPLFNLLWSKEFKTKKEAKKFAKEYTIEDIINLKEDWIDSNLKQAKRIIDSGIELKWQIKKIKVEELYI